jgi:tetratricopeptide (TPR) repeat protein
VGSFDAALGRLARLLGNHDEALAHFDAAEALNTGLGARFFTARDAVARAIAHLARGEDGDRAAAEEHATRALELARANGDAAVEARASAFLDALPPV